MQTKQIIFLSLFKFRLLRRPLLHKKIDEFPNNFIMMPERSTNFSK